MRESRLKSNHGITEADYNSLLKAQSGVCRICKTHPEKHLAVDHDHSTGRIRGLLCRRCNSAIGLFDEDPEKLLSAVAYLNRDKLMHEHMGHKAFEPSCKLCQEALEGLPEIVHPYRCECELCTDPRVDHS